MEIWLSAGGKDKFQFPVNPEEISSNLERNYEDIVLSSGNERTIISGMNLFECSFSSFFPKNAPYYKSSKQVLAPMTYVKKIKSWMKSGKVLLLQVTKLGINAEVTIRDFSYKEVGGAVGDIEFDISFKEYKPVAFTKVKVTTPKKSVSKKTTTRSSVNSNKNKLPLTYTVKKGDCLWNIAKRYYGDATQWRKIYNKNKGVVGKNPNLIYPGQKLVIPK